MKLSCHCGNIKIDVEVPEELTQCNCSICSRYMSLWGYYQIGEPTIEIKEKGYNSYSCGNKELNFIRCANCGCVTHYETKVNHPDPRIAINFSLVRQLISQIPVRYFNGAQRL